MGRQPAAGPSFRGFITNVDGQLHAVPDDGTPVRAEVDITITEPGEIPRPARTRPRTPPNSRRVHQIIEGDSLQSVAYRELGKAAYWRAIAELNAIDDPMRVPAGTVLLIPTVADAAKSA